MDSKAKILIATSTRADWGLLRPLAEALQSADWCRLQIMATNMHLLEAYGMTISEITDAGFAVDARVAMDAAGDDEASRVKAMAQCMAGTAEALSRLCPDAIVVLGDRYEMLAVASAAAVMRVPIVHIAGGEISEGAIDDSIRHAITKLSSLHLVATEPYRRRVIQMGEHPARVVNTGAIGVWNVLNRQLLSRSELETDLGFSLDGPLAVVTYHPVTLDDADPRALCRRMLEALDRHRQLRLIITYPNNDARSEGIIAELQSYAAARPGRVLLVKSLGMVRYLSVLQYACMVIGNSSSGIVEVPSMGIPTVDIGIRQRGRLAAPSVLHCADTADAIADTISRALTEPVCSMAAQRVNPYYKPDTPGIMVSAVHHFVSAMPRGKTFFDIDFDTSSPQI